MLSGYYYIGKCLSKFFRSRAEGEGFLQQARIKTENLGNRALRVPGWLHEMVVEGQARLSPYGKTLKEAVDPLFCQPPRQRAVARSSSSSRVSWPPGKPM